MKKKPCMGFEPMISAILVHTIDLAKLCLSLKSSNYFNYNHQ